MVENLGTLDGGREQGGSSSPLRVIKGWGEGAGRQLPSQGGGREQGDSSPLRMGGGGGGGGGGGAGRLELPSQALVRG